MTAASEYDVVIVGAGVLGVSTAFWLAEKSSLQVALLERQRPGAGSTGKSAAIVRMHYTNPITVQLALRSRRLFADWATALRRSAPPAVTTPYTPCGWVFMVPPDQKGNFARNLEMNRAQGVDVASVDHEWLQANLPGISVDGIGAAAHEPTSGYADPVAVCHELAEAADERGVAVFEDTAATELLVENGVVVGARAQAAAGGDSVEVRGEHTAVAAGPWSGALLQPVGVQVPLQVMREQELVLETDAPIPGIAVSNMCDQIYLRPAPGGQSAPNGRLLVGRGYPKDYQEVDPDSYDERHDAEFADDVLTRLGHRFPQLRDARVTAGVVGLYAVTPDWHPVVGPAESVPGLWLACGGSGHAFKIGPALGELLADCIHTGSCDWADGDAFRLSRFAAADATASGPQPFASSYGGNRA